MPPNAEAEAPEGGSGFGLLLLCFFLSGLAALIYQTAWTRQFAFVFGTSELAVASVLAAYMGGLALGAAVIGRFAHRIRRPVLVYGLLELAIGLAALAVPAGVSVATRLYVSIFGAQGAPADEGGLLSALFYLVCSFALLLVPTSLMGATLPLLARHAVRREEEIGRRIGHLYATNTAGAVAGTVVSGFVLLPTLGLETTVWIAVGANFAVFAAAAALAKVAPAAASDSAPVAATDPRDPNTWILPMIAASGAVSFTYEVLWTRLLGHVLGGSVYAFATMLATFLTGIAIGSWLASGRLASDRRSATGGFAWAQVGAGLLSLTAYLAIDATPAWVEALALKGDVRLLLDAAISAGILLPGTLCIGATFPLAVRVLARSREEAGGASARVYAWNTVGAIVGAVGAGFFLIPAVGFAWTLTLAVATNAILAALTALRGRPRPRLALAAAAVVIALLVVVQPGPPWQLLRMGMLASRVKQTHVVYYGVGRSSTVLLQRASDGWQLSSNALSEAMINERGVRGGRFVIVRWMSNLPAWGRPQSRRILVVGFGGGLVVEAVPDNFEAVHVVEIEPEIIQANAKIAKRRQRDPLSDPRLELIVNDARGALLLTQERYDAIVSQPSHPWTAAASHLYTREFFQLARDHLSDDGVFVQWMGLSFIDESLMKTLVATLLDVFPNVRVYRPALGGLLFTAAPKPFEPERTVAEFVAKSNEHASQLGVSSGEDLVAHMLLDDEGSRAFAKGAAVSTDDRNLLQMNSPRIVRSVGRFDPDPSTAAHDSLAAAEIPWNRAYLIRRMQAAGQQARAERVAAAATDPAERHVGAGLVHRYKGDLRRAASEFAKAVEIDPQNTEARIALLRLGQTGAARAELLRRLSSAPTPVESLLDEGWGHEKSKRWEDVRALEPRLAAVGPQHPAYLDVASMRASWRAAEGSKERAHEALAIIDEAIPLGASLNEFVTRALAAETAGLPAGARATLNEFARKVRGKRHEAAIRRVLAMLPGLSEETLPNDQRQTFARQLRAKLR